ncbi:MAG: HAD-IC family P-type ATPase [Clostridia bacterium]|nr:HAD-IC family P-type ATPase [Clostridia bacterium]
MKANSSKKENNAAYCDQALSVDEQGFNKRKYVNYYKRHPKKAIDVNVERFETNIESGLSEKQVQTRFTQYLFNCTNKQYSKSYASIFIGNICTFFNLLCLIAFVVLLLAKTSGFSNYLVIVITSANVIIGIIQETRSKLSIDKLSLIAASTVKVLRDGIVCDIPSEEIVLDDLILLETGNQVPADCILLEGSVEVNESLLTGESVPVKKVAGDLLYSGSFIASGNGKFKVEKVGKETYINKLAAKAKKYKRPNSELMNSTQLIIKCISVLMVFIAVGTFIISKANYVPTEGIEDYIFSAQTNFALQRTCAVIIGMIPSGMLLLTSVALALGVIRLAKRNTLVQDLYSLEMLARVNVLCLDKTGTITDGNMKVNDYILLNDAKNYDVKDIMGSMLKALNDGNQTSVALFNYFGYSQKLNAKAIVAFSSKRKLSAVEFEDAGTFCFGAPEFVLKPMPNEVKKAVENYASKGLRVLVLAHSNGKIEGDNLPENFEPVALISIADNVREEAITTIKWFKENDVAVKVISGDNPLTVSEVAKRAGVENAENYVSLEGLSDEEVKKVANEYTVFGRVSPEQKAILIKAIKAQGNTVAMTGDGVNDILALKDADCAISVASGSEAARNVSHLVLMDNNFNSMPQIVAEGRRVINNIKNSSSLFLMKTLFTLLLSTLCIIMGVPYIFMPQNLLLLEVIVIGLPSVALSMQPNNERVEGKFISHVLSRSVPGALVMTACVMTTYLASIISPEIFGDCCKALCTLALTFSGIVMLFWVCWPLNKFRAILFTVMLTAGVVAFIIPPFTDAMFCKGWLDIVWNINNLLPFIIAVVAAIPISFILIKALQKLMPIIEKAIDKIIKKFKTPN